MKKLFGIITLLIALTACHREEYFPKPKAFLRLEYPPHRYEKFYPPLPFSFEKSYLARWENKSDTAFNLYYPSMKARIYMTYSPIHNNLKKLLMDADKLTYKHAIKATGFPANDFVKPQKQVYGRLTLVTGNAASPLQFYLTDSTHHFVTGSLYFRAVPNYDSVRPPLEYLKQDIIHLMETWEWKSQQ